MRTQESTGVRRRATLASVATISVTTVVAAVAFAGPALAHSDGETHRVYATRVGLVGQTTANGHVITERDHFVALPSTRALSARASGAYTVRVCRADSTHCAYAPVWDVGPWNIADDYWSATRHGFPDLPKGLPQAQAAYYSGHHGGRDQFGRAVTNPAGIDLADGTFSGLGLRDNSWVDVTFLWQGDAPTGVIRSTGAPVYVRSGPGRGYAVRGLAANYARVPVLCTVRGEWIDGYLGYTNLWNKIGPDNYISDAYTRTGTGDPISPPC
jgi:hypothetical protein